MIYMGLLYMKIMIHFVQYRTDPFPRDKSFELRRRASVPFQVAVGAVKFARALEPGSRWSGSNIEQKQLTTLKTNIERV